MTNSNFNEESETDKLFKELEENSLFPEFDKNLNKGYARTIDFFDNLVGGDKRSFEEILENPLDRQLVDHLLTTRGQQYMI